MDGNVSEKLSRGIADELGEEKEGLLQNSSPLLCQQRSGFVQSVLLC